MRRLLLLAVYASHLLLTSSERPRAMSPAIDPDRLSRDSDGSLSDSEDSDEGTEGETEGEDSDIEGTEGETEEDTTDEDFSSSESAVEAEDKGKPEKVTIVKEVSGSKELEEQEEILDDGKTSEEKLEEIKAVWAKGGKVSLSLDSLKKSQQAVDEAARDWAVKPHQALVSLHHRLVGATHDTESVLYGDALRLDHALKQNLEDETGKMDLIALDPASRMQVILDNGKSHIMTPPGPFDDLIGKRVQCHSYEGDANIEAEKVNGQIGVVQTFSRGSSKYAVNLEQNNFQVYLTKDQMTTLFGAAQKAADPDKWCSDFLNEDVRVDSIPQPIRAEMERKHLPESALRYQVGKVAKCFAAESADGKSGKPSFEIHIKNDAYSYEVKMGGWPRLVALRDFHRVKQLIDKQVVVTTANSGVVGTNTYKPGIKAIGTVQSYAEGKYTVKIPEHEVTVNPEDVQRDARHMHEAAPDPALRDNVLFRDAETGHTLEGVIFSVSGAEGKEFGIDVDGHDPRYLGKDDFVITQPKICSDASGDDPVGHPVKWTDEKAPGVEQLGLVLSVISGPPCVYAVQDVSEDIQRKVASDFTRLEESPVEGEGEQLIGKPVEFQVGGADGAGGADRESTAKKSGKITAVLPTQPGDTFIYVVEENPGKEKHYLLYKDFKVLEPDQERLAGLEAEMKKKAVEQKYDEAKKVQEQITGFNEQIEKKAELQQAVDAQKAKETEDMEPAPATRDVDIATLQERRDAVLKAESCTNCYAPDGISALIMEAKALLAKLEEKEEDKCKALREAVKAAKKIQDDTPKTELDPAIEKLDTTLNAEGIGDCPKLIAVAKPLLEKLQAQAAKAAEPAA